MTDADHENDNMEGATSSGSAHNKIRIVILGSLVLLNIVAFIYFWRISDKTAGFNLVLLGKIAGELIVVLLLPYFLIRIIVTKKGISISRYIEVTLAAFFALAALSFVVETLGVACPKLATIPAAIFFNMPIAIGYISISNSLRTCKSIMHGVGIFWITSGLFWYYVFVQSMVFSFIYCLYRPVSSMQFVSSKDPIGN
ncbi:hypothetical protein ACFL54_07290 [Planctomycetota bacterium]